MDEGATSGSSPWWCSPRCGGMTVPRGITRPSKEKRTSLEAKPCGEEGSHQDLAMNALLSALNCNTCPFTAQ